ncbi:MAG: hypothetical protein IKQ37_11790 [Bacteroidaceae bacterium]|nr:hypothetical protein [Bacteroidaceae bacterium]
MAEKKSQKGADGIVMKRKIYQQLLDWKEKRRGEVACGRRIVSYLTEVFRATQIQ